MKRELLFYDNMDAQQYLSRLLSIYPYDIEEDMVYTLLNETTYPHPVLLSFITYFANITKLHILTEKQEKQPVSLQTLFMKMSSLAQANSGVLQNHHFDFMANFTLSKHTFSHPYAHLPFHKILFIDDIQLFHIPLLSMCDYEKIPIQRKEHFIFRDISIDASQYVAISIEITQKHGLVFLSKNCLSLAIPLRAMFHSDRPSIHQDFILIFGLMDTEKRMEYYFDETNELYIGLVCGDASIYHFLYLKDMILTLHNAMRIHQHDLPIHASMIQLQVAQQTIGILFAGEQDAGKSEMLQAMAEQCQKQNISYRIFFDDHGILHYLDNEIVATASELSACRKLHPYDLYTVFKDFNDTLFLKEDQVHLYQITPCISYESSYCFQPVHYIFYLDHTLHDNHILPIESIEACSALFQKGRKGQGLPCSSYYFNSCGCEEDDEGLSKLLDEFITRFFLHSLPIYQLFTHGSDHQLQQLFRRYAKLILQQILQEKNC